MRLNIRQRLTRPIGRAVIALSFVLAALPVNAAAPGGGSSALTFGTSTVDFRSSAIEFPSQTTSAGTESAETVEVTVPADVLFDFDKADIRPAAQPALHELAVLLKEQARGAVTVTGHTDAVGDPAYNQNLSERRSAAVKTWLISREGLGSLAMTTSGAGARQPVAPNKRPDGSDDPDGRQLYRRVTVVFRK